MPKFVPQQIREKISNTLKARGIRPPSRLGLKDSEETKNKKRIASLKNGNRPPSWLGRKLSEEHKRKLSIIHKNLHKDLRGDKNPCWMGGLSFEPYSIDWTSTLRRSIRERDNYTCRLCKKIQGDKAFSVHHIDYDKKNCDPNNLITLCNSCHGRTVTNREYWTEYFYGLL